MAMKPLIPNSFLAGHETFDTQFFSCSHHALGPTSQFFLGSGRGLLGHNFTVIVLLEAIFSQSAFALGAASVHDLASASSHWCFLLASDFSCFLSGGSSSGASSGSPTSSTSTSSTSASSSGSHGW